MISGKLATIDLHAAEGRFGEATGALRQGTLTVSKFKKLKRAKVGA